MAARPKLATWFSARSNLKKSGSPAWTWLICGILFLATFVNYANRVVVTQKSFEIKDAYERALKLKPSRLRSTS